MLQFKAKILLSLLYKLAEFFAKNGDYKFQLNARLTQVN